MNYARRKLMESQSHAKVIEIPRLDASDASHSARPVGAGENTAQQGPVSAMRAEVVPIAMFGKLERQAPRPRGIKQAHEPLLKDHANRDAVGHPMLIDDAHEIRVLLAQHERP